MNNECKRLKENENSSSKDDDMAHGANLGHLKQMMSYKTRGQSYLDFGEFCI